MNRVSLRNPLEPGGGSPRDATPCDAASRGAASRDGGPRAEALSREEVRELLARGMDHAERKVERRILDAALAEFERSDKLAFESPLGERGLVAEQLLLFLLNRVAEQLATIHGLRKRYTEYVKRYSRALDAADARRHILEFARELGASPRKLRGDERAFSRWFGHDAVCERYVCRCGRLEREIVFGLGRIGALCELLLGSEAEGRSVPAEWARLGLESRLRPFLAHDGDSRVTTAALAALSRGLRALPPSARERIVEESTLQFIYRCAMHPRLDVWLQCEAISLLESLSPSSLEKVLRERFAKPSGGDDIFVRRRAVQILAGNLGRDPRLAAILPQAAEDPSPFVRQGLAEALRRAPVRHARVWFRHLATEDAAAQVRGTAIREALDLLDRPELRRDILNVLASILREEKEEIVLRVAMHVVAEGASKLVGLGDPLSTLWATRLADGLEHLHVSSPSVPTRRRAAEARERVWCAIDPRARGLRRIFESCLLSLGRSESQSFPADLLDFRDADLAGRVLAVISQADFGFDVVPSGNRVRVTRGEVFGFRLWRFLHELRNPSPDKRQAFRHTIGRIFRGTIRAPSGILCELAETRVPGEPLFIGEEGGWRPYLPLLDDCIAALRLTGRSLPASIYTGEGVTEIRPPETWIRRVAAHLRVSNGFVRIAKLRNWKPQLQESPNTYLRTLRDLGFVVTFRPHPGIDGKPAPVDPEVRKFFPVAIPFLDGDILEQMKEYFLSVYGNTVLDLAIFSSLAIGYFLGKHIYANRMVHRCRENIPLVIGGWGTRGKSGTERLKAALMNALGYGVVSKTTGCEAMFLYAHPFTKTREMFLFRSYDKATIWEQRNVLRTAELLGADVFLWECMALTPSYVEVLQKHWVRDDISTITNTYPDHEDLQGPAGINIPEVISMFIPRKSRLLTTEEMMLPILAEEAKRQGTSMRAVNWLDASLLAPDVLARFPYDEHPYNISLVLALADELGVPRDFALKEMADRVVPDLGVLKTYPTAEVEGRRLRFANGMSANERHGTISNWLRCGFDAQDPIAEPGVWISTVVNNRADRVPRSRVFARILVEDISADKHFLIGGNLNGLVGYIHQAWATYAPTISLWPPDGPPDPAGVFLEMARRFRMPTDPAHVRARLEAMVGGTAAPEELRGALGRDLEDLTKLKSLLESQDIGQHRHLDEILEHHDANLTAFREFSAFREKIQAAASTRSEALDAEFRDLLWKWFHRKIVVVEDYYISGEQLNHLIARKTPPGYLNRVMGIQNIKGTGLDFVYRWQAWDACHKACDLLESDDPQAAAQGLKALSSFHEYGILSKSHVAKVLEKAKGFRVLQDAGSQAELAMIAAHYHESMTALDEKLRSAKAESSRMEKAIALVEAFFDAGDAVRRRKLANRIYKDLVALRISTERAAHELQQLNKRQKGGWLLKRFEAARDLVTRNVGTILARGVK